MSAKVKPGREAVPSENLAVPCTSRVSVVVAEFRVSPVDHWGIAPEEVRTVFAAPMVRGVRADDPAP